MKKIGKNIHKFLAFVCIIGYFCKNYNMPVMKRLLCLLVAAASAFAATSLYAQVLPYQDKSLPAEQRAKDLLGRLTLEEKANLMCQRSPAVERLGIKEYWWWNEALHGVARNGSATTFPMPIGMAASFDDDLVYDVFTTVSDEARVKNRMAIKANGHSGFYSGVTFWTPNINIFRDPRWGRGMETYGEDPYLMGRMGVSVVKGLQGPDDSPIRKAHACAKHFAVHSGPESQRHSMDVSVSERDLRETYLAAFKELVIKGGVEEVMTAYQRVDGIPCSAHPKLIGDILRGEWGYKGIMVSDCGAIHDFYTKGHHGYAPDPETAAALAVKAGEDLECGDTYRHLPEAVSRGLVTEEEIDVCLLRLLTDRFRLGEMDGESPWDDLDESIIESDEHLALALKMARESIVLLKNDGVLPLKKEAKVALIGPNANDMEMMWGNYNAIPKRNTTLLEAFGQRVEDVVTFPACPLAGPGEVISNDELLSRLDGIETVVFAGGLSPRLEGEEMPVYIPGFSGGDRTSIELPEVQRKMLKTLHDAGKKVVFVCFSGSAIALVPETASCNAIVQAWYPGQTGGTAVAEVLFGETNPSGKLPVTFYASDSQLPDFLDYDMKGHTYRFMTEQPLFPFGYGLSYTTFKVSRPRVRGGNIIVKVRNTGKMDGDEVVQVYISRKGDKVGPSKTLRAFRRVSVKAGKRVKVKIPIDDETFLWWSDTLLDMVPVHGRYRIMAGTSSADKDLKGVNYRF